jgi:phage-related protein
MLFDAKMQPLQLIIIIFSNQAEIFDSPFLTVDISHVDGEHLAFLNSHQSLGRQMVDRVVKYIHWDIDGKACEGIEK